MLRALIWDVDGTLAETERDGHRVAFNGAFDGALAECDDLASPAPLRSSVVPLARGPVSLRALREWLAFAAGGGCRSGYVDGARGEGRAADRSLRDDRGERSNVSGKGAGDGVGPLPQARRVRSREAQERRPAREARIVPPTRGDCLSGARAASVASFAAQAGAPSIAGHPREAGASTRRACGKGPTPSPAPLRAQNFRTPGIERRDSCSALQSH